MTKKILITLITLAAITTSASDANAQAYGQGAYGQGVVLGKGEDVEIVHEVKDAGLRENIAVAGGLIIGASAYLYNLYRKEKAYI